MSMLGGTVTVNNDLSSSGTGLAIALYNARIAALVAQAPSYLSLLVLADKVTTYRLIGVMAVADAGAIVTYLTASAVTTTIVSVGGLQNTPSPNNQATATAAPGSPQTLTGTLS